MKKINIIILLSIFIVISAFALGFIVAKSIEGKNINTNTNVNNVIIGEKEHKININTSDKAELMSIEGIGDKRADLIIANRPYKNIWDLSNVNGIGEEFVKKNEGRLII
jgi:competence protein ComEA